MKLGQLEAHEPVEQGLLGDPFKSFLHGKPKVHREPLVFLAFHHGLGPAVQARGGDGFGIRNRNGHEVDAQCVFHPTDDGLFAPADEGDGYALLARAGGAAGAVGVVGVVVGQVEMEDVGHVLHIDAARRHIRCDEDLQVLQFEPLHHAVALRLGEVAVKGINSVAFFHKSLSQFLGVALRAAKHHAEEVLVQIHEPGEGLGFIGIAHHGVAVLDLFVDGRFWIDADFMRVRHVLLDQAPNLLGHGRGKQPGALRVRRHGQNRVEFFLEPHVEHLIRFIEDDAFDLVEGDGSALGEVDQPAGCGDDHLARLAELTDLRRDVGAAVDGCGADALVVFGKQLNLLGDLLAQFTRGRQHQRLHMRL